MDNFVHVCALAAVSSLCEVLLHYAMNALGARAMSYSSLNPWEPEAHMAQTGFQDATG